MRGPTFTEFEHFLRKHLDLDQHDKVIPTTLFEDHLGVSGDDGVDLLDATEKQFGVSFEPLWETFSMQPNEYLFHGEGFGQIDLPWLMGKLWPFGPSIWKPTTCRKFTVGELYEAVYRKLTDQA